MAPAFGQRGTKNKIKPFKLLTKAFNKTYQKKKSNGRLGLWQKKKIKKKKKEGRRRRRSNEEEEEEEEEERG